MTRDNQQRFKQWGILKQVFRGDIVQHSQVFGVYAIVTQLAIENGEPLFQVDHKYPDFDNFYFDEYSGQEDYNE